MKPIATFTAAALIAALAGPTLAARAGGHSGPHAATTAPKAASAQVTVADPSGAPPHMTRRHGRGTNGAYGWPVWWDAGYGPGPDATEAGPGGPPGYPPFGEMAVPPAHACPEVLHWSDKSQSATRQWLCHPAVLTRAGQGSQPAL